VLELQSSNYYCFVNHIQLSDQLHYRKNVANKSVVTETVFAVPQAKQVGLK